MPTSDPNQSSPQERLIATAIRLLAEVGPEALQVRRIAEAAGVSSIVVYRRFGGMPQLVERVIETGFARLAEQFRAAPASDDPLADIFRLGLTYHRLASENPHLFDLMFGLSTPGGYRQIARPARSAAPAPNDADDSSLSGAYRVMFAHAERAIAMGRIRDEDPERVAAELWSFLHGFVVLDLSGQFAHLPDPVATVLGNLAAHVAIGLGDVPERAAASSASALQAFRATPAP